MKLIYTEAHNKYTPVRLFIRYSRITYNTKQTGIKEGPGLIIGVLRKRFHVALVL